MLFIISVLFLAVIGKNLYQYTASKGLLGDKAQSKFYSQTKQGQDVMSILMAGRAEFFIGMRAIFDNPIMGFGAMAEDEKGYWADFIWRYGNIDDYELFNKLTARRAQYGGRLYIPVHSYIVSFWGLSGIIGLIFSIYIFYLIFIFFRRYLYAIPNWSGYFACSIPTVIWGMFFSPYGHGITGPMLFTGLLMARAVGMGKMSLPYPILKEAQEYD